MASKVEVVGDGFDCDDETTFLFTSESVGEGHPGGNRAKITAKVFLYTAHCIYFFLVYNLNARAIEPV